MVSDNGSIHYLYVIRIKCYHWNTSLCQAKIRTENVYWQTIRYALSTTTSCHYLTATNHYRKTVCLLEKASDPMLKSNITIKEPISTNFKSEYPKAEITVLIISSNKGIPDTLKICYPMNTQFLPPQIARKDYLW